MAIKHVVTEGFGFADGVAFIPTFGFGGFSAAVGGPFSLEGACVCEEDFPLCGCADPFPATLTVTTTYGVFTVTWQGTYWAGDLFYTKEDNERCSGTTALIEARVRPNCGTTRFTVELFAYYCYFAYGEITPSSLVFAAGPVADISDVPCIVAHPNVSTTVCTRPINFSGTFGFWTIQSNGVSAASINYAGTLVAGPIEHAPGGYTVTE